MRSREEIEADAECIGREDISSSEEFNRMSCLQLEALLDIRDLLSRLAPSNNKTHHPPSPPPPKVKNT